MKNPPLKGGTIPTPASESPTETYGAIRSASKENKDRFKEDILIRNWNFRILSRPTNDPKDAIWSLNDIHYTHDEAFARAMNLQRKKDNEEKNK